MLIKVCGMREQQNATYICKLDISMMGFIFHEESPRYVGELTPSTSKNILRVGVFVNKELDYILDMANRNHLDAVQLHGSESIELCIMLREKGYKVFKAISIAEKSDLLKCGEYEQYVDIYVFDTKCSGFGGSGKRFDWDILKSYNGTTPFLLSGGIDITMIEEINNFYHPMMYGVDLNSRFEISPAIKDVDTLKYFIEKFKK